MDKPQLIKDQLGQHAVITLSQTLSNVMDGFPAEQFIIDANAGFDELALKQRVSHLITVLANYLPVDFIGAAKVLIAIKLHWQQTDANASWSSFTVWPLIDYVAVYGLEQPELALNVLKTLTPLFTAEFALRPFIEQHFELTYRHLLTWCNDEDAHVRRLASEGIRPRLPWGKQLSQLRKDPQAIFQILELLKDDSSLYVQKSVANNLNDIAKDHPEKVIKLCQQWQRDATDERFWIIRHGLRSLVKAGRADVFPLLGYSEKLAIKIAQFKLAETEIKVGQNLTISVLLLSRSTDRQKMVIDYRIYHVKANGTLTNKVFKWRNISLAPQQAVALQKRHSFKLISTRKYYAGKHAIELLINGVSYGKIKFNLVL